MEHDTKVFKVQRIRFCNIWDLPSDHTFDKEFLMSIINGELAADITYNNVKTQITFSMKFLARELLRVEHNTYTK